MTRDLPEEMIDAEPAGGWVSGEVADGETAASSADAAFPQAVDEERSFADAPPAPDGERPADPFVESAEIQQGEDPDLLTDDQARS